MRSSYNPVMSVLLGRILRTVESGPKRHVREVVLIEAGWSLNGGFYPAATLIAAVQEGLFERRPAMLLERVTADGSVADHQTEDDLVGKEVLNQVGFYESARWDPDVGERGAVVANLVVLESEDEDHVSQRFLSHLKALEESEGMDTIGLSINGLGSEPTSDGRIDQIDEIFSVDIVTQPAAGGKIGHRVAASVSRPKRDRSPKPMKLLAALRAMFPVLMSGLRLTESDSEGVILKTLIRRIKESEEAAKEAGEHLDEDPAELREMDATELLDQAMQILAAAKEQIGGVAGGDTEEPVEEADGDEEEELSDEEKKKIKKALSESERNAAAAAASAKSAKASERKALLRESRLLLKDQITSQKLPTAVGTRMLKAYDKAPVILTESAAKSLVKEQVEIIDEVLQTRGASDLTVLREARDNQGDILAYMFHDGVDVSNEVKTMAQKELGMSFSRFMEAFLGVDIRDAVRGHGHRMRMREAINDTNFDQVFADVMNRAVLAEYGGLTKYNFDRIVSYESFNDFRSRKLVTLGYYGNLPTVAKGGSYVALTTPTDRQETIALAKKGGTESILMEDVLNDDLGLYQAMVKRIGRAAKETAYATVMSLIRKASQPTMADGDKLTDLTRSPANELTVALSKDAAGKTAFINAVIQMMSQTGGSGEKKGVTPSTIILPLQLVEAWSYIRKELVGGLTGVEVRETMEQLGAVIPELMIDLGTTNATDWFLHSNEVKNLVFATLGGRREPEIFLADDERFGNMFTKDQLDLKVRFIYAAAAADFVGVQGNDVA